MHGNHRMSIESIGVPTLLRAHIHVQGVLLTEDELSKLWVSCLGYEATGRWQVREYARVTGVGAREYRVVRGSSIRDVYRSPDRGRAAAVGTALDELDTSRANSLARQSENARIPARHRGSKLAFVHQSLTYRCRVDSDNGSAAAPTIPSKGHWFVTVAGKQYRLFEAWYDDVATAVRRAETTRRIIDAVVQYDQLRTHELCLRSLPA
jgi:hypothetical protein